MLAPPWRSDLTSVPCRTMPASSVSSMKKSCRALRFCTAMRPGAVSRAIMSSLDADSIQQPGRGHRRAHALLRGVRDLADRQARQRLRAAEQAGGILDRPGAGLDEECLVEGRQAFVDQHHRVEVAPLPGLVQLGA